MKKLKDYLNEYGEYKIKDEETLLKLLEKPKPKTIWDLTHGDEYWFLYHNGDIILCSWDDDDIDNGRRDIGNCYLTKKEAEFAFEQKRTFVEMEHLGGVKNMMSLGNCNNYKYYIKYDHSINKICIDDFCCTQYPLNIYFETVKQAQKVIDIIGEDRIKKYLFYIEE